MPTNSRQQTARQVLGLYPDMRKRKIANVNLHSHELPGNHLENSILDEVIYSDIDGQKSWFTDVIANNVCFDYSDLTGSDFSGFSGNYNSFFQTNLSYTIWGNGCHLHDDFSGAIGAISFPRVGSRADTLLVVKHGRILMFKTGCFWGTEKEFANAVRAKYEWGSFHRKEYFDCIKKAHKALD